MTDLKIYYSCQNGLTHYIECWSSEFSYSNKSITVETYTTKTNFENLYNNILPGAVRENFIPGYGQEYYDATWEMENTIKLEPTSTNMSNMRKDVICYVKSIRSEPVEGAGGYLHIKMDCVISGQVL